MDDEVPQTHDAAVPLVEWQAAVVANTVIALAYLAISVAVVRPLVATGQWRKNRLGMATAAIFLTCAGHHAGHGVHMMLPALGLEADHGLAMREAFHWHQVAWDVVGVVVALYYWSLRASYGALLQGAKLFDDLKEKQRQALELNDQVVQGLVVAQMALEIDDRDASQQALEETLQRARGIIGELLHETTPDRVRPGDLVRASPAAVLEGTANRG